MSKISVAEYIANFLAEHNLNTIFAISGASDLRLLDSIHQHEKLKYYCPHHEQAGVMAAIGHFRITGQPGVMLVTAGPGGANTVTGIASAFLDSIPVLLLGGQEKSEYLTNNLNLRGKGVQGLNLVEIVKPITKSALLITEPNKIKFYLEKALFEATSGRPGPVWLDIPQDIQAVLVEPSQLEGFIPSKQIQSNWNTQIDKITQLLKKSERPLIWVGHGVRLAKAEKDFLQLLEKLNIPTLTAWNGADIMYETHPCYAGRAGTYGNRASNFILQNCDLLIALGTRLAIPQMGYSSSEFARAAKKVIVEIDPTEMSKFQFEIDVPILGCVGNFIKQWNSILDRNPIQLSIGKWFEYCKTIRLKYPTVTTDEKKPLTSKVNSYHFMEILTNLLPADTNIATDMGTSLTCTHAVFKIKKGQRLVTSTGLGEMGFGLPCAIGVAIASQKENKKTVFVGAEGSFQMNIQEMQTVIHHKLPIKTFMLNNNIYLTIKHTENALFGPNRLSGCSVESGVSFPDLKKIALAYGFNYFEINNNDQIESVVSDVMNCEGPVFCNVFMPDDQFLGPKTAVKVKADGSLYSPPLEDMYPFLDRKELESNMIISPLKGE
jgi:acetolactate synthase-1/2/3 large subunit